MIKTDYKDYNWKWAANATNEEFLVYYKKEPLNLFLNLILECIDDKNCSLKTLVDPILEKIANLPLQKNDESIIADFFEKIIKCKENSDSHIRSLLGLYLKAVYQDSKKLAYTTCMLMCPSLAKKAEANFSEKSQLQSIDEKRLLMLSEQGDLRQIQKMIEDGIDVNTSDPLGFTSLHIACIRGHVDLVKLFLSFENLEINKTNLQGATSLLIATVYQKVEIISLLIEKGALINQANLNRETPLMVAAMAGNTELCALLIENGASLEKKSSTGATAFIASCKQEKLSTLELLIEKGALMCAKDKQGLNAADYAMAHNHFSVVDFLAKKNIFPSVTITLAHACKNHNIEQINFLLKNKELKKMTSDQAHEILNYAFQTRHFPLFEAVFDKKALKVAARIWLLHAYTADLVEFKKFLKDQGADIDEKINGKTLLYEYSKRNNLEQVKNLLKFGADIDLQDDEGLTPLMIALLRNQLDIAEYLIHKGASLCIKSNSKLTALTLGNEGQLDKLFDKLCSNVIKNYSSK